MELIERRHLTEREAAVFAISCRRFSLLLVVGGTVVAVINFYLHYLHSTYTPQRSDVQFVAGECK